ncbi:MAG: bifunctional phosphopantothenoylcysteine decarboxylase/phosphopantothenate--cysteine ligase CoaBC [Eubacterium sp.]|nr:bifunctional phosphopantothenoylcysteine decarboxylase/phosphopantothenate--cysteine ligase CoaBC [Eubacterium sp.]
MLKEKNVLLGVTGGIAAYKACELASALVKQHADVNVIMTKNATEFVAPLTFDALTHNRTVTDTFDRMHSYEIEHISLAEKADVIVIAPASANVIAKLANGLADDMLTTTVLASRAVKLIAPAMNTNMYENPVTQHNLEVLKGYGWEIIGPDSGRLACGTTGRGKMVSPERLLDAVEHAIAHEKDMAGVKLMVTAGPTQEAVDPVRYLTNHSSGKMGYAIATAAARRGAEVTLVSGRTGLDRPGYMEVVDVVSAGDMYEAVTARAEGMDMIVKAAAVADFRPAVCAEDKIKKTGTEEDATIALERTDDILAWLGAHKGAEQVLCGFSMETKDMLENSRRKLTKKNLDIIAANNLKEAGAGFRVDTNLLTLIRPEEEKVLPLMTKYEAANVLLDELMRIRKEKRSLR